MPRLTADLVTTAEVTLKPSLLKKLQLKIHDYSVLVGQMKALKKKIEGDVKTGTPGAKTELETLFAEADEYEALVAGVRVVVPGIGEVPLKIVEGMSAGTLDKKKLMKKFNLTPADLASCTSKPKAKKSYLGIWLPKEQDGSDEEGDDE